MAQSELIGIFLASSGSQSDRLLFKYPYESTEATRTEQKRPLRNKYAVRICEDLRNISCPMSSVENGVLVGFSDAILANLFAVQVSLCRKKFELKINDIVFVGFPEVTHYRVQPKRESTTMTSFNVVFALSSKADRCVIDCYADLAKQLAIALGHEEKRCGYLTEHKNIMWTAQDEVAAMPEDTEESPYRLMLKRSALARQLRAVYYSLTSTGVVNIHVNRWIPVNFCLPHKVHNVYQQQPPKLTSVCMERCIKSLRPYHAMLLLEDSETLLESLPPDSSPSLARLVSPTVVSPFKNLQALASDADLTIQQVYLLVSHLVQWGKATIIYPLCETNIYVLAPNTNTDANSSVMDKFVKQFPGVSLLAVMAQFSLPTRLGEHRDVLGLPQQQAQQVQMVVWMLQHRLLMQLHTYIFYTRASRPSRPQRLRLLTEGFYSNGYHGGHRRVASMSECDAMSLVSEDLRSVSFSVQTPSLEGTSDTVTEERSSWHHEDLLRQLPMEDRDLIMSCPASSNVEDLKMFLRLISYFNGKHHIEEIMFYENERRSTLMALLDKFRSLLCTCQHEDPGIVFCQQLCGS